MKSPLLIGTAVSNYHQNGHAALSDQLQLDQLAPETLSILKTKLLLAFNQDDQTGAPAHPYKWGYNPDHTFDASHPAEYWSGSFKQGTLILMLNTEDETASRTAVWSEVPELVGKEGENGFRVVDGWTGEDLGCVVGEYEVRVESHDTAVLHVQGPC